MAPREPVGWVLHDDACGFCRWWIPFWSATLRKRGFEIAPLQDPWVEQRLSLPPDELIRDLRLLLADGRLVAATDYVFSRQTGQLVDCEQDNSNWALVGKKLCRRGKSARGNNDRTPCAGCYGGSHNSLNFTDGQPAVSI